MSTIEDQPKTTAGETCPFVRYEEVNVTKADPLWHFDNFNRLREEARVHFGDAAGHEFWLLTEMGDIRAAFQKPELFSSTAVSPSDPDPPYMWIPEMLDPPLHTKWRQLLGPTFTPAAIAKLEPKVKQRFGEILDEIAPRGECDYVADVALRFPNTIFMEIMGLPVSDAPMFQGWETDILHSGSVGNEKSLIAMNEVIGYFAGLVAERRKTPREDLVSVALTYVIDGQPVSDDDLLSMCLLLFMAGLDTVAMQLSYSMMHLAQHDDDRRKLVENPQLFPTAIEEFLRYYAFVTPGRKIMQDSEFQGCPMKAGQMVYLPLVAANRDPKEFVDAGKVIVDRADNRHIAFGAGPHRCLGSHLARQELRIGLVDWHARIPNYRLADGAKIVEHGGQVGLDNLPLVWDV
ncbi:MAG: cytochrome [Acidimicrobiia bacterium]|nr:cytochrome [Acidimicrobiia bacterium]